ncbi:FeoA family protein [Thermosulfuriphilus sp.]
MKRCLGDYSAGARLRVVSIKGKGALKRRILDMGLVPGAILEVERVAPLGDPVAIKLRGYHLSLRREEAQCVLVEPQ